MPVSKDRCTEVILYANEHGDEEAQSFFGLPLETITRYRRAFNAYEISTVDEIDDEGALVKLEASKQKSTDVNRLLRKANRESYRLYNTLETIYDEYITTLKSSGFVDFTVKPHKVKYSGKQGILQISDTHFNELIYPMESNGNSYDFNIASKRLKKFVSEAIPIFKLYNIDQVLIAITGDLINSDRRLSEKMASATSQVRAALLATYLLQQVIIELSEHFSVSVASVVGNESRLGIDDFDSSDTLVSNNWDVMIYNNLRMLFDGKPIEFIDALNQVQQVVTLDNGFNVLLIHGNYQKAPISDKSIGTILQSYIYKGVPIHAVICGHIHSASIGDMVSRSSSLCGANAYSTNDLMFISRASQNLLIVNEDLGYHGMKLDLQNTDGYDGYNIIKELERYNVRGI